MVNRSAESDSGQYRPLVSIVIPVYNGGDFMREAIDSALSQTYENVEVLVINDGSCDGGETEAIARSYADRIRYFAKDNGGCASALNLGLEVMRGDWFSWLSHDDVYLPTKVESALNQVVENRLDPQRTVVSCGSVLIDADGRVLRRVRPPRSGLLESAQASEWLLKGRNFNGCSLLIPRTAIESIGLFNTEHVYVLDWEYWVALALSGHAFYLYPEPLVKNRRHANQVSIRASHRQEGELREVYAHLARVELLSPHIDNSVLSSAWIGARRANAVDAYRSVAMRLRAAGASVGVQRRIDGLLANLMRRAKAAVRGGLGRG